MRLTAVGADGGSDILPPNQGGGMGTTVTGVFPVQAGDEIHYVVGVQGGVGEDGDGGATGVIIFRPSTGVSTLVLVAARGAGLDNTGQNETATGGIDDSGMGGLANDANTTFPGGVGATGIRCASFPQTAAINGQGGAGGNVGCIPQLQAAGTTFPNGLFTDGAGQSGESGVTGGGSADLDASDGLSVAAGGAPGDPDGGVGGQGFTGGGGDSNEAAGAGGNSGASAGAGSSFVAPLTFAGTEIYTPGLNLSDSNTGNGNGSITIETLTITLEKIVVNDSSGILEPEDFVLGLSSTHGDVTTATAYASGDVIGFVANGGSNSYTLSEDSSSYTETDNSCAPLTLTVTDIGTDFICTITNNDPLPAPALSMNKVANSTGPFTVGEVITYTYTVTNRRYGYWGCCHYRQS